MILMPTGPTVCDCTKPDPQPVWPFPNAVQCGRCLRAILGLRHPTAVESDKTRRGGRPPSAPAGNPEGRSA